MFKLQEIGKEGFSEQNFVSLLLPLLRKNGIYKIDVNELKRKLFYYYMKEEYSEIFSCLKLSAGTVIDEVDIDNGLKYEKLFGSNITWDIERPNILNLNYARDYDLSKYEAKLSNSNVLLMRKMAEEISISLKMETQSKYKLVIYNCEPNKSYTLTYGRFRYKNLGWQLLTDGVIKSSAYFGFEKFKGHYFDNPAIPNSLIKYRDAIISKINISDSSYVIMQGIKSGNIRHAKAYTKSTDPEVLHKIIEIANTNYTDEDNLLVKEKPFVRRITLK